MQNNTAGRFTAERWNFRRVAVKKETWMVVVPLLRRGGEKEENQEGLSLSDFSDLWLLRLSLRFPEVQIGFWPFYNSTTCAYQQL